MLVVVAMTGSGLTGVARLDGLLHAREDRYRQNGPDTALRERPVLTPGYPASSRPPRCPSTMVLNASETSASR
jgi:hypothetical protein